VSFYFLALSSCFFVLFCSCSCICGLGLHACFVPYEVSGEISIQSNLIFMSEGYRACCRQSLLLDWIFRLTYFLRGKGLENGGLDEKA
jgi:hypothetical protein